MSDNLLGIPGLTFGGVGNWAIVAVLLAAFIRAWPKLKELEIGKNAGLRREFIEEMQALREEVTGLRNENGMLRQEVRELHKVIDGMRRGNLASNIEIQREIIGDRPVSAPLKRALKSLDEITGGTE